MGDLAMSASGRSLLEPFYTTQHYLCRVFGCFLLANERLFLIGGVAGAALRLSGLNVDSSCFSFPHSQLTPTVKLACGAAWDFRLKTSI